MYLLHHIFQMAKSDLDGSEVLCSGCLLVRSATLGMGPVLSWVPDELNNETRYEIHSKVSLLVCR